jgi:glyoxylase-like metal-dependent hydrolase (beta-lactamase superfamily II)
MRDVKRMILLLLAAIGLFSNGPSAQQPDGEPFSRSIRKVKDGFYVVPGYDGATTGGNVGVRVTGDGIILVDSNKVENIAAVLQQVRTVSTLPIKFELGTHSHADHSGGNGEVAKTGAVIVAHRNMRDAMVKGNQAGPPSVVYDHELTLFLGGAEVRAYYFGPGHTDGDSVIYFPDLKVVQVGDLVLWGKRSDGSTLVPAINYPTGANLTKLMAAVDGILKLDFDTAIPGHGPVLTRSTVQTYRQNLGVLKQRMKDAVRAGVKKEELPTKIKLDDLGWPLAPALLSSMYDEMAAEQ